jgi:hypothetical protein
MRITEIIESLRGHHGQNIAAKWRKTCKTRKEFSSFVVEKETTATVRGGINFENLRSVRDGIENGERGEVQELPWGEWAMFPVHIAHKGADYVRLYPPTGGISQRPKVQWYLDGSPVEYALVEELLLASEKPRDEAPDCFTLKVENLISIGR